MDTCGTRNSPRGQKKKKSKRGSKALLNGHFGAGMRNGRRAHTHARTQASMTACERSFRAEKGGPILGAVSSAARYRNNTQFQVLGAVVAEEKNKIIDVRRNRKRGWEHNEPTPPPNFFLDLCVQDILRTIRRTFLACLSLSLSLIHIRRRCGGSHPHWVSNAVMLPGSARW